MTDAEAMTDRFPDEATWTGRVSPDDLTEEERLEIRKGVLGYCEGHGVLYKKWALHSCLIPAVFPDGLGKKCSEWTGGPKEWSPRWRGQGEGPVG